MNTRIAVLALLAAVLPGGCGRDERPSSSRTAPAALPQAPAATARRYALFRTIPAGVGAPAGLASDGAGRLYVAGDEVRVLDRDLAEIARWRPGGRATCAAGDGRGAVYLGVEPPDGRTGPCIEKRDRSGTLLTAWGERGRGEGRILMATGISVSGDRVYVADPANRRIHTYDTDGRFIRDIGGRGPGTPGIVCPSPYLDCAAGPGGTVAAPNPGMHRVAVYGPSGGVVREFGKQGVRPEEFSGCCNPTNLVLLPDGAVATAEKRPPRVKVYGAGGDLLAYIGPEPFHADAAGMDLAADANGRLCVLDPAAGAVLVFERRGGR